MASEKKPATTSETEKNWLKPQSLGGFLRDVGIALAVCAVFLWVYKGSVERGQQVRELGREAREYAVKDQPAAFDEAVKRFTQILELDDSDAFAIASMGEIEAIRFTDFGLAASEQPMHEWAAKAGKLEANINEQFGAVLYDMLGSGRVADALKLGEELTQRTASSHVLNGYGRAFMASGELAKAKIALKRAADTEWRNPRFTCDLADAYFADGDYANAQTFFAKGVEANSAHARSLVGVARSQIARKTRMEDASKTLMEVIEEKTETMGVKTKALAYVGAGEYFLANGLLDQAAAMQEKALAEDAKSPWAYFLKGRILAAAQRPEAVDAFKKAVELNKYVPEFYFASAKSLEAGGMGEHALALLESAKTILPQDDRYLMAVGDQLKGLNRLDEALATYEKALEYNDMNAQAHFARGVLLIDHKKNIELGQEEFQKALIAQEYFPEVRIKQAEMLFSTKKWEDGVQEYAQALIQMKQLGRPADQSNAMRNMVNDRLLKEAKDKEMAKAWMSETASMVQ